MGNTMSTCLAVLDCSHVLRKRKLKQKIRAINKEKKEIEERLEQCDANLQEVKEFKSKFKIPDVILRTLERGEEELLEERYMLNSELFDLTTKVTEALTEKMGFGQDVVDHPKNEAICLTEL